MSATLGVATLSYLPYAIFNFATPLLTIAGAYAGFRMLSDPGTHKRVTESPASSAVNDKAA
jgi:NhaC family Na+:H+ antiporter